MHAKAPTSNALASRLYTNMDAMDTSGDIPRNKVPNVVNSTYPAMVICQLLTGSDPATIWGDVWVRVGENV